MTKAKQQKVFPKRKLTIQEKRLVAARVQGATQVEAYRAAGYSVKDKKIAAINATRKINKPHIQQAIDEALAAEGATPQWAVAQLKAVAEQNAEVGAKRLAAKDILELHGWNKADRPTVQLDIKNAFFQGARKTESTILDVTPEPETEE